MAAFLDEAGALENADMAGYGGPADGKLMRELAGGALPGAQRVQNRAAGRIRDRAKAAGGAGM